MWLVSPKHDPRGPAFGRKEMSLTFTAPLLICTLAQVALSTHLWISEWPSAKVNPVVTVDVGQTVHPAIDCRQPSDCGRDKSANR